ncbi:hypothetical protein [Methylobacterium nigriterrae]|uniref:hypothetical protein n=1 Tax=Methylobacterium nigriterrae TaxID=3127512 RepID=UPI003013D6EA
MTRIFAVALAVALIAAGLALPAAVLADDGSRQPAGGAFMSSYSQNVWRPASSPEPQATGALAVAEGRTAPRWAAKAHRRTRR